MFLDVCKEEQGRKQRGTTRGSPGVRRQEVSWAALNAQVDRFSQVSGSGINSSWLDRRGWAPGGRYTESKSFD